jgi:hypothetical protein
MSHNDKELSASKNGEQVLRSEDVSKIGGKALEAVLHGSEPSDSIESFSSKASYKFNFSLHS